MKKVEVPKSVELWRIICASQSEPGYSEDRLVLLYGGESDYEDRYVLLTGGHCSCYGWEEVQWCAVEYTVDELVALANGNLANECTEAHERLFWRSALRALGKWDV